jgi:hypothetical protein
MNCFSSGYRCLETTCGAFTLPLQRRFIEMMGNRKWLRRMLP